MGLVYFLLLPKSAIFRSQNTSYMAISTSEDENEAVPTQGPNRTSRIEQGEEEDDDNVDDTATIMLPSTPGTGILDNISPVVKPNLSARDKMEIAKPLFWPFMIPLFVVYFAEVSKIIYSGIVNLVTIFCCDKKAKYYHLRDLIAIVYC
jgi:hypothetical protein